MERKGSVPSLFGYFVRLALIVAAVVILSTMLWKNVDAPKERQPRETTVETNAPTEETTPATTAPEETTPMTTTAPEETAEQTTAPERAA